MVAGSNPVAPTVNGMIDTISVIPFFVYTNAPGHRLTINPKRIVVTLLFNNVSMNLRALAALTEDIKKEETLMVSSLVAVRTGLEPVTPCVTGMYSNQLN